ncbi:RNA polymerase II-associated protein 3-like isoform X3 [Dermacentor andersoni]|uniref:RNA polymerase II-associated protein 3-like isoform X3 n=1 Tax=Dermacentor andersoni TaxID=34620 RepID=UPI002155DED6|nr:RNA polymerase II-associated protein 3-like isoform X3 [Dermacentor andersoni]
MPSEPRCQPSTTKTRNAAYEEYLRNLRNWEASIKMKDAQLRSLKSKLQPATEPMPVKRPASSEDKNTPCTGSAVSDSMVALETLINDESTSETSGSDDEQFQAEWKRQRALIEKEKGNRLFKDGRYDEAIESYGIGIECDPQNPVLYANRAMAFLRKNMYGAAEEDCNRALEWDPNYIKAYHRRGLARQSLSKKALAAEDFRMVLSLESNNKEARQHLTKLEKELKAGAGDMVTTKASSSSHSLNAKEPAGQVEKPAKKGSAAEKMSLPIRAVTAVKVEPLTAPRTRRVSEQRLLKRVPIRDVPGGTRLKEEWVAATKTHKPQLPPPAPSSYQFQVDWRQLAPFPELRYRYLKQMNPSKLGTFFQESMETELFCDILCILENQFMRDGVDIYPILSSLPKVGRFSTLVMFLGSEDKKRLARLLAIASKVDPGLADSYGL